MRLESGGAASIKARCFTAMASAGAHRVMNPGGSLGGTFTGID